MVHAGHTQAQGVGGREGAQTLQGRNHRDVGFLGQVGQFLVGPGSGDAVTVQDDRALGLVNHVGGLFNLASVAEDGRAVAAQFYLGWVACEISLRLEDIFRNIDQHRAGATRLGQVEGFLDGFGQVFGVHHQPVMLGNRQGDTGNVGFLEGVFAD